jgi:hypothetical protein
MFARQQLGRHVPAAKNIRTNKRMVVDTRFLYNACHIKEHFVGPSV